MGKGVLIVALGISILISIIGLNLMRNANQNTDATVEFYKNTQARLISNSGIEVFLEKLRRNKGLSGTFKNNSLLGGKYDISISGPDTALKIRSSSSFQDAIHKSVVLARRTLVVIPDIHSSIYVSSNNLTLNLNGNIDISGYDHTADGTHSVTDPVPGIGVDDPVDSAFIVNNIKGHLTNQITGSGASPSVTTVKDNTDWLTITENFIFAADTVLTTGTYTTGTVLGTFSQPKITYANGDVQFSGDASGSGILVVNGNLTLSGNFIFKGIVIAYGKSTIVTKTVGNSGIFGAAVFVGQSVDIQVTGTSQFYYSSQAIQNAKQNIRSSRFNIVSWWE